MTRRGFITVLTAVVFGKPWETRAAAVPGFTVGSMYREFPAGTVVMLHASEAVIPAPGVVVGKLTIDASLAFKRELQRVDRSTKQAQ